ALGEPIDGSQACDWGLANRAVASSVVDTVAVELAVRLAERAPNAIRHTKGLMRDAASMWELMLREGEIFSAQMRSPEAVEAFTAFMQKRKPSF
ncbi:enoyl-CoA hydratase-related protein, partial [Brevundimonas sp.]